jgi:AcrR family transcriptional regulator
VSPRKYEMTRRAAMADATRRRIVEATLELHIERGVLGTSMRDIAARADVAPGTVARHFPDYEDVVSACGKLVRERYPAPTSEIFHGASTVEERVERLVVAWFGFHAVQPHYYSLQADRAALPPLDAYLSEVEQQHRALCAQALRPTQARQARIRQLRALTDYGVWRSLADQGATPQAAARQVCAVLGPWLDAA